MKKLILLLAALAIVGCRCDSAAKPSKLHDNGRFKLITVIDDRNDFAIFCDTSTNIAYLRYWGGESKNGITVYMNSKGEPARCNEIQR